MTRLKDAGRFTHVVARRDQVSSRSRIGGPRSVGDAHLDVGPCGGPLDLTGFRNRSFKGETAALNLYARGLTQRQVAVLHRQVAKIEATL
jgi:hypothetical protein